MINTVTVYGNITKDPKSLGEGKVVKTSIAVNEGRGDKEQVSFFDLVFFGKLAEVALQHITKGKEMVVTGRLRQERWEKDGETRTNIVIIVNDIQFCGRPNKENASAPAAEDNEAPF